MASSWEDGPNAPPAVDESYFALNDLRYFPAAASHSFALSTSLTKFSESSCLGRVVNNNIRLDVRINTHDPFCLVAVGVQGGGKSHTMCSLLESCLLPCSVENFVDLRSPMSVVVMHYDSSITAQCEVLGIVDANPTIGLQSLRQVAYPREKITILTSASFYEQRKKFYEPRGVKVRPLLIPWRELTANHIKIIMGIQANDSQLYVATMLQLLRKHQRANRMPSFELFLLEVEEACCKVPGQGGALKQRLALLSSLVRESKENIFIQAESQYMESCLPDSLVIVDLTNPLMSRSEVNDVFHLLTEKYQSMRMSCGKLLMLDEAHKYMDGSAGSGGESDGLSKAIVNIARTMRHDGMRLAVSTQSPLALAPELLELVSVAVIHQFHSRDWFSYLKGKLTLEDSAWPEVQDLQTGHALVFGKCDPADELAQHQVASHLGKYFCKIRIRPRLTRDLGASKCNEIA